MAIQRGRGVIAMVIRCFVRCCCRQRRSKSKPQAEAESFDDAESSEARAFRLDIHDAEYLRLSASKLDEGTLGTTYRASLAGDPVVAKLLRNFNVPEEEFEDLVHEIEKVNHQNLLPLRAYHNDVNAKILVYEYMPKGSLSSLLHGNGRTPLDWETRTRIAVEAARAIAHIHSLDPSISHGNIKSSNVFLTPTFEVRVSEFGIASVVRPTHFDGFCAPEVNDANRATQKADVYSFGVLLLELLTGKDPDESHLKDEGLDLAKWVLSAVNLEWTSEVFDLELLQCDNVVECMLNFLNLAFRCTVEDPWNRPSMAEVMNQIVRLSSY